MKAILVLFVSILGFTSANASDDLPNLEALKRWHNLPDYVSSPVKPEELPEKAFECIDQNLYPTHPQQEIKKYHTYEWGEYDHHQLKGSDQACALPAERSSLKIKPCLKAHIALHVLMSDTFVNSCGQTFRGFMDLRFLEANESMGTLFSWGRTSYQNPKSDYPNDYVSGGTYPVERSRFMKLTELFPTDSSKIEQSLKQAASTHTYDPKTHTFIQN